jgi:hypothetical protein
VGHQEIPLHFWKTLHSGLEESPRLHSRPVCSVSLFLFWNKKSLSTFGKLFILALNRVRNFIRDLFAVVCSVHY